MQKFKEEREGVEDHSKGRRPTTFKTELYSDRRLTIRPMANEMETKRDSVWKIITEDLNMQKFCGKMVSKRIQMCQDILGHFETQPDLLVSEFGDKSWIFECNPETKRQILQRKSPTSQGRRKPDSQSSK